MPPVADAIVYTEPFKDQVGGQLAARFRLDSAGRPISQRYPGTDRRLQFYTIDLLLKGPYANPVQTVDYLVDHPSFDDDPEASSNDLDNEFPVVIESYGDVEIVVTAHVNGRKFQQRAWLSNMLDNYYSGGRTASLDVREAIDRIKAF